MIVNFQLDMSDPRDVEVFQRLGWVVANPETPDDAPAETEAPKKRGRKAKEPETAVEPEAPAVESAPSVPPVTAQDIQKVFTECQSVNVKAAGQAMKAFLDRKEAKTVRDLDDEGLAELKAELDILYLDLSEQVF